MKILYIITLIIGVLLLAIGADAFAGNAVLNTSRLILGMLMLVFGVYGVIKLIGKKN